MVAEVTIVICNDKCMTIISNNEFGRGTAATVDVHYYRDERQGERGLNRELN